jgi:hypothetical protein
MTKTYPQSRLELEREGYVMHTMFQHNNIVSFVKTYFFRTNPVILFYWLFNAVVFLFFVLLPIFSEAFRAQLHLVLIGLVGFLFLVPIHELIHGIGYRLAGARTVSYRVVWRKFVVYAMADRFVTRRHWFVALALAPFALINCALMILIMATDGGWSAVMTGALIMHTAGCSGDFALVSYFYTFWSRHPITYDEEAEGRTVFMLLPE